MPHKQTLVCPSYQLTLCFQTARPVKCWPDCLGDSPTLFATPELTSMLSLVSIPHHPTLHSAIICLRINVAQYDTTPTSVWCISVDLYYPMVLRFPPHTPGPRVKKFPVLNFLMQNLVFCTLWRCIVNRHLCIALLPGPKGQMMFFCQKAFAGFSS